MLVERRIKNEPRLVVAIVAGDEQTAAHPCGKVADVGAFQRDLAAVAGDCLQVGDVAGAHHGIRSADAGNGYGGGQDR
jgi:hypothetical protein